MTATKDGCKIDSVLHGNMTTPKPGQKRWAITIFFESGVTRNHRKEIIKLLKQRGSVKNMKMVKTSPKGIQMAVIGTDASIGLEADRVITQVREYLKEATPKPPQSRRRRGYRHGKTLASPAPRPYTA